LAFEGIGLAPFILVFILILIIESMCEKEASIIPILSGKEERQKLRSLLDDV
jgi:hypothetical protein